MHNILAIWQREMKSYFVSPIAYAVLIVFLFIAGLVFYGNLADAVQYTMMQGQFGQGTQAIDLPAFIMERLFGTTSVVLLFILPMLTMGLFSEEKKRGTIELLLTSPVGNLQAILGKYLASLTVLIILFLSSGFTISSLFIYSKPDWKPMLAGYLGMFLFGAAVLAIGLFISTLTENQIVAVVITFGVSLFLWLISIFGGLAGPVTKKVIEYLSVISHLDDFIMKGVIDTSHIIYYITFAFVGLFLAYRSLESMRWKG
jgi:ABC-2 type transport system permease protein